MAEIPDRLIALFHAGMPRNLQRAHTFFRIHDNTDGHKPEFQRQVGTVKYRFSLRGELIAETIHAFMQAAEQATWRNVFAILARASRNAHLGDILLSTLDAAHSKRPAQVDETVDALIFGPEFGGYVYQQTWIFGGRQGGILM